MLHVSLIPMEHCEYLPRQSQGQYIYQLIFTEPFEQFYQELKRLVLLLQDQYYGNILCSTISMHRFKK